MKKSFIKTIVGSFLGLTLLMGCGTPSKQIQSNDKKIENLKIAFVPSVDPEKIITSTEPLKGALKNELKKAGYEVENVDITVGTSYEAVGEGLVSGTIDVGFIPGATYVLYDDGAEVGLVATRKALNKSSDNPKDWNDGKPSEHTGEKAISYKSIIVAGPSEKGRELSSKINNGEKLTWEDLNSAKWSVLGPNSSSGYIYPTLWLKENYDKTIADLSDKVQSDSHGSSIARLASEQVDVAVFFGDARTGHEDKWQSDYGRNKSIWEETNVIGVTPSIYSDTVSFSKSSKIMTEEFKNAFKKAMIDIANTEEGKKIISIYSHEGYEQASSSDYDNERKVQKLIRELNR